jgi:hypothetical protein
LPGDVAAFLGEADRRIERFRIDRPIAAFVPSDFASVYSALRALAEADVAAGNLFCEWGSGFGVVTCLAAMLDFDACGIEIEAELIEAARTLADDFDVPVEFIHGSFIPEGSQPRVSVGEGFAWLTTHSDISHDEVGLGPDDFDVIFAYPWPDEEDVIEVMFDDHARAGAILVTYHGGEDVRVRRKERRKSRRSRSRS